MSLDTQFVLKRLEILESEIAALRKQLVTSGSPDAAPTMRGIWKDIEITDEEVEEVKNSWMRRLDDLAN
jgi:hypothetical protein